MAQLAQTCRELDAMNQDDATYFIQQLREARHYVAKRASKTECGVKDAQGGMLRRMEPNRKTRGRWMPQN